MASALLVAVLEPGEWDIREEDLVDALVECELKLVIECDCVGGSTWHVKANGAWASENVAWSDALFLEPGRIFVHLKLFVGTLLFEGRAQGDVDGDHTSTV